MKPSALAGGWTMVGAFVVWLAHFMGCWVAVEVWPRQWQANAAAWVATLLALLALAVLWTRLGQRRDAGELTQWNRRFGRRAIVLAAAAVVFGVVPSLVFRP